MKHIVQDLYVAEDGTVFTTAGKLYENVENHRDLFFDIPEEGGEK